MDFQKFINSFWLNFSFNICIKFIFQHRRFKIDSSFLLSLFFFSKSFDSIPSSISPPIIIPLETFSRREEKNVASAMVIRGTNARPFRSEQNGKRKNLFALETFSRRYHGYQRCAALIQPRSASDTSAKWYFARIVRPWYIFVEIFSCPLFIRCSVLPWKAEF